MKLPPIIQRELKQRASRTKTWWIRFAIVLVAALGWVLLLTTGGISTGSGKVALAMASAVPVLIAAFCGVVTTADCLSRERRDRTLELLLITELRPLEIAMQKLVATTMPVFSALIAVAPLSLIAVSLGGVSGTEALAVGVLTVVAAFLSAVFGLVVSSMAQSVISASAGTFTICALFFGTSLLPGLQTSGSALGQLLFLANPLSLCRAIFLNPVANVAVSDVLTTAALGFGVGIAGLLLTSLLLRRVPNQAKAAVCGRERTLFERTVAVTCAAGLPLLAGFCLLLPASVSLLVVAVLAGTLAKLLVLASTVRILNARPWLEMVLTTPLSPIKYIRQEIGRLLPRLAGVLSFCLVAELIVLFRLPTGFRILALAITILVVLDAIALGVVGLWNGLKYRSLNEAMSFSISSVVLLPIAVTGILVAFGFRTATLSGGVALWILLCVAVDLLMVAAANWMLAHRLRMTASL